jgi:aryl-alcohol dehydrogenase-like predicted oxidoreductase
MEYRFLGRSGFKVPALGFGAGTFGGKGPPFSAWGNSDERDARRLIDLCLDAGVNLFDTADVYSDGASETILGAAIKGRRNRGFCRPSLRFGRVTAPTTLARHELT